MSANDANGAEVIADHYLAFYRTMCVRGNVPAMRDDDTIFWAISGLPHPIANVVARTRWGDDLTVEATDARIQETLAPFRERGMPALWYVWPSSQPRDLGSRLEAQELLPDPEGDAPGMTLDLTAPLTETPLPEGLRVEQIRDGATFARWLDVFLTGYGLVAAESGAAEEGASEGALMRQIAALLGYEEPVRQYLGWIGETSVASATLFLANGVAGIYNVATLPEARGRGVGAAITAYALREGRALGARTAILLSSPMGERIYQRLGFVERCRVGQYYWLPQGAGV